jgi:ATP-dependent exoDNAse (exonuclease V) beta subunit
VSEGAEQLSFDVPEPEAAAIEPESATPGRASADPASTPHPPTAEQAAAIDSRGRDVFLEAGAGTGKTRVLVERYCDAVDIDGVEPERILAFTFTEKAAAEMRRRVRIELLRRAAIASGQEHAARLRAAGQAGETAPITTIHGFCRRLLAAHPVAAGLDPGFRVLDADEASRLAAIAFDEALDELAAVDDAVAAIAAAYRNRRLRGLIRGAYDDLRNHGSRSPDLPPLQISAFEGKEHAERVPDPEMIELAQTSYGAIRDLLVAYGRRYDAVKAERSGVDFDDLQLLSLELLRSSDAIAATQRERFDHLLVDEFQDTSP